MNPVFFSYPDNMPKLSDRVRAEELVLVDTQVQISHKVLVARTFTCIY